MPNLKIFEKLTPKIVVNIAKQTLTLTLPNEQGDCDSHEFTISTAKNGIGSQEGSGCTPLGKHFIAEKIGANTSINSVFVGRVPTGEIYDEDLGKQYPNRDWILSRILWLSGCEEGRNKGENDQGCCDTYHRYIYIHGTPDTEPMGTPLSHGCVRMRNDEMVWLFDQVEEGTPVEIIAS